MCQRVISWFDLKVSGRGYREQETLINKPELRYGQELLANCASEAPGSPNALRESGRAVYHCQILYDIHR